MRPKTATRLTCLDLFRRAGRGLRHPAIAISIFAAFYFGAAKLGLSFALVNKSVSPVWPPTGLALAVLLTWGIRLWPGVFIGVFLVNFTTQGSLLTVLGIATGNTLEAVVAAVLVGRFANGRRFFERTRDVFKFVFFAAILSTTISATFGTTCLALDGLAGWSEYRMIWLTWWLGDVTSNLTVAPLLLVWWNSQRPQLNTKTILEGAGLFATVILVSAVVFSGVLPFAYLTLPPLVWAAFRFGARTVLLAMLLLMGIALRSTMIGEGPFASPDANQSVLFLQAYMGTCTIMVLVLSSVIAGRNSAEQALRESEAKFRQVTETITEVFWITDPGKNRMIYISPAYEAIWGRTCDSLIASPMNWVEAIHPEDRDRVVDASFTKQADGTYDEVYRIQRPDGSIRWIHDRAFAVSEPSGGVHRIVGIAEDITTRKLAEAQIAMLDYAVESTSEMICITDMQDRFVFVNRALEQGYGYTAGELLGKTPDILFSPDNPPALLKEIIEQTRLGGWRGEVNDLRKDGIEIPVALSTSLIKDANGEVIGLMGVARDITAHREAEFALRESERRLRLIAENTTDVIFAFDMNRRPIFVNPAVVALTGYSFAEIREKHFINWIHPEDEERMLAHWNGLFAGKPYADVEFRLVTKSGQIRWCSGSWGPIRDEHGCQIGVQGREKDITLRRELEQQILEISAIERRRVGHDLHDGLGQWLAGIALKTKTLEENLEDENSPQSVTAKEIVALMNNAISQTRALAAGLDPVHSEADGLSHALKKLVEQSNSLFGRECIFISHEESLSVSPQTGLALYRITQEAIHNAIKHGNARRIEVQLEADEKRLRLKIRDDGNGFSPDTGSGTGMGLRIMQYRANSLGGDLKIQAQSESGVEIICTVPMNHAG